jgi:RHS repeat-associated protein
MCLVDLPTGRLGLNETDWDLALPMPLRQVRSYRSTNIWRGDLGYGWGHSWGIRFWSDEPGVATLRLPDGRRASIELPAAGKTTLNAAERVSVACRPAAVLPSASARSRTNATCYLVQLPDTPTLAFSNQAVGEQGFLWLGMLDRSSNWVEIVPDGAGRPQRVDIPWQRTLRLERSPEGLLTEIWLESPSCPQPGVCLVRYGYDAAFDLVTIEDAAGVRRYRYRDHLLIQHVGRTGGLCTSEFDLKRRCVMTCGPKSVRKRVYVYDPVRRETRVTNSVGATSAYRSNQQDMVAEVEDPAGKKSIFEYDHAYRVARATDQLGHVTQFVYGPNGAIVSKIGPKGYADAIETNARGEVVRHLSPAGAPISEASRDPLGRVLSIARAGQGTTQYQWNPDGTIKATVQPAGHKVTSTWDAERLVHTETDAQGLVTRRTLDILGNITEYEDADGNKTKVAYDPGGRLRSIEHPDGARQGLRTDPEGNLLEAIDETGTSTQFAYNEADSVVAKRIDGILVGTVEYDSENRPVRASGQDGIPYELTYNEVGNVVKQKFPDGRVEEYRYDAAKRLHQLIDPRGDVVEASYDAAGRLIAVQYPDGNHKAISRNEDGAWLTVEARGFLCQREYDERGRIAQESQDGFFHNLEYNDAELLGSVTASDGRRLDFAYNEKGAITELVVREGRWRDDDWQAGQTERRHAFAYDRLGKCVLWTMPGGKREERAYNKRGWLVSQEIFCGERRIVARKFAYDAAGRVIKRTDSLRGDARYDYDALGQLIAAREGARDDRFKYDQHGDRMGENVTYLSGHRVQTWGDVHFAYDDRGFVVARRRPQGTDEFDYNYQGLLTRFLSARGRSIAYRYDGLARLRVKEEAGQQTVFRWDRNQLWSMEQTDGRIIQFVILPGELVPREQTIDGQSYTLHTDHLGRAMELIDDAGNIAWRNEQDVWGRGREGTSARRVECLWEYPGQIWDADIELYYHRYRMYDPQTAHFIVPDPVGLWGGLNAYAYPVDPVNMMDPLGLECLGVADTPTIYRGTGNRRSPSQVCADGFTPKDPTQTVLQHVNGGCGWISTAYDAAEAETFAEMGRQDYGTGYVYVIDNPGCGVEVDCDPDVQQDLADNGGDPVADSEREIAFNKKIPGKNILGYYDVSLGPASFQTC